MRRARHVGVALLLGLGITLASSFVKGSALVAYPDIDSCVPTCSVVVAGFPFAFIADYPGISPVGSASLLGVLLGVDLVRVTELLGTLACWSVLSAVSLGLVRSHRRPRNAGL